MINIFSDDVLKSAAKISYYNYCKQYNIKCDISDDIYKTYLQLIQSYNYSDSVIKDLYKQVSNIARRKCRLRRRIEYLLINYECCFVTFTLNEQHINYPIKTIRDTINRLLRELNCYFIGNIDFGSTTERLHFHFIIAASCKKYLKQRYSKDLNYGFIDYRAITRKNSYRLSSYIDKLNNHALKPSTMTLRKANIICSRGEFAFNKINI